MLFAYARGFESKCIANGNRAVVIRGVAAPETCRSGEKHSIPERLENAKRECAERKVPD